MLSKDAPQGWDVLLRTHPPTHPSRRQTLAANRVDRYVTRQALALFVLAPQALYAVNRHVDLQPYRTTFELADTSGRLTHRARR